MTNMGRHAPNLSISSFCNDDFEPAQVIIIALAHGRGALPEVGRRDFPNLGWKRRAILERNAGSQFAERFFGRCAFYLYQIGFWHLLFGFGNSGLQGAIIRQ